MLQVGAFQAIRLHFKNIENLHLKTKKEKLTTLFHILCIYDANIGLFLVDLSDKRKTKDSQTIQRFFKDSAFVSSSSQAVQVFEFMLVIKTAQKVKMKMMPKK